jgi:hypothetical protein
MPAALQALIAMLKAEASGTDDASEPRLAPRPTAATRAASR